MGPPYDPDSPGDPRGLGNPNWNRPWGYPQQQHQYPDHQWDPHHQQDPKLSKYDGGLPWRDYKVKLEHMAQQYGWDDNKKLAKLVEAIEGKALSYYGALDELICQNYQQVSLKFNARFYPQEPARTAHNQLAVLTQKPGGGVGGICRMCSPVGYRCLEQCPPLKQPTK